LRHIRKQIRFLWHTRKHTYPSDSPCNQKRPCSSGFGLQMIFTAKLKIRTSSHCCGKILHFKIARYTVANVQLNIKTWQTRHWENTFTYAASVMQTVDFWTENQANNGNSRWCAGASAQITSKPREQCYFGNSRWDASAQIASNWLERLREAEKIRKESGKFFQKFPNLRQGCAHPAFSAPWTNIHQNCKNSTQILIQIKIEKKLKIELTF
jgi:hypothetical protein